jgi:hypothetical protein
MATRRKRARTADGKLAGDNPATPDVNEAWEDGKTAAQIKAEKEAGVEVVEEALEEAQAPEEAPAVEEPAVEPEAPVAVETPAAAAPVDTTALAEMLADKRKDPEKTEQPKDEGLKPMTEERLAEIRASAITPASVEKAGVDQIIAEAGVEKTRGREIAARLMFNARRNGGFV